MKLVSLLSGGIDSAVSSYLLLPKAEIVLVHFQNLTSSTNSVQNKVEMIAEQLSKYGKARLLIVPFKEAQFELIKFVPSQFRMIVYKRLMLRIAQEIARKEVALGLIVGDSMGQVASQTLPNIRTIYEAVDLPIFTPLIGKDKSEIMKIASEIGTLEISNLPYPDCCSFMLSKHPSTRAKLEVIKEIEKNIDFERIIKSCLTGANALDLTSLKGS